MQSSINSSQHGAWEKIYGTITCAILPHLTKSEIQVYVALSSFQGKQSHCAVSLRSIAQRARISSLCQLSRIIYRLKSLALIECSSIKSSVKEYRVQPKAGPYAALPLSFLHAKPSKSMLLVYAGLSSFQGTAQQCFPTRMQIGARVGIKSMPYISHALHELKKQGWLDSQRQGPRSNVYVLTCAGDERMSQKDVLNSSNKQTSSYQSKEPLSQKDVLISSNKQMSSHQSKERMSQKDVLVSSNKQTSSYQSKEPLSQKDVLISSNKQMLSHQSKERMSQKDVLVSSNKQTSSYQSKEPLSKKDVLISSNKQTSSYQSKERLSQKDVLVSSNKQMLSCQNEEVFCKKMSSFRQERGPHSVNPSTKKNPYKNPVSTASTTTITKSKAADSPNTQHAVQKPSLFPQTLSHQSKERMSQKDVLISSNKQMSSHQSKERLSKKDVLVSSNKQISSYQSKERLSKKDVLVSSNKQMSSYQNEEVFCKKTSSFRQERGPHSVNPSTKKNPYKNPVSTASTTTITKSKAADSPNTQHAVQKPSLFPQTLSHQSKEHLSKKDVLISSNKQISSYQSKEHLSKKDVLISSNKQTSSYQSKEHLSKKDVLISSNKQMSSHQSKERMSQKDVLVSSNKQTSSYYDQHVFLQKAQTSTGNAPVLQAQSHAYMKMDKGKAKVLAELEQGLYPHVPDHMRRFYELSVVGELQGEIVLEVESAYTVPEILRESIQKYDGRNLKIIYIQPQAVQSRRHSWPRRAPVKKNFRCAY